MIFLFLNIPFISRSNMINEKETLLYNSEKSTNKLIFFIFYFACVITMGIIMIYSGTTCIDYMNAGSRYISQKFIIKYWNISNEDNFIIGNITMSPYDPIYCRPLSVCNSSNVYTTIKCLNTTYPINSEINGYFDYYNPIMTCYINDPRPYTIWCRINDISIYIFFPNLAILVIIFVLLFDKYKSNK